MRISRIFIEAPLKLNLQTFLDKKKSHYLLQVLRLKLGSTIFLFNGNGYEYHTEITAIDKKMAQITILSVSEKEKLPPLNIHLGIGLSKGDRLDLAIQKSVELGVSQISLLQTQFTAVKFNQERSNKKLTHWQGIIHSACEQAGRSYIPQLNPPQPLSDWLKANEESASTRLILNPLSSNSMKAFSVDKALTLLVGPEGGLSEKEITQAEQSQFQSARLGTHILRTETAPLAAIAAAQILWGDFI